MLESRRNFLLTLGAASAALGLSAQASLSQTAKPSPPPARVPETAAGDDDNGLPKSGTKAILEENDKDIKKKIEKLFELATDLKAEVEKTDSAKVLSLIMVKKAEEIEKLARDIKTRARG
jgi:hypothetical protein